VLLTHRPGDATTLAAEAFSPGLFVFSADGKELGAIKSAGGRSFHVERPDGSVLELPLSAAESVQGGRMVLYWDAMMVETEDKHRQG
jgi:hypothetical protein